MLGDMACVAVSLLGLVLVRRHLEMLYVSEVWLALFIIGLWPLIVMVTGGYDKRYLGDGSDEYRRIFQATAVMASSVAIVAYATQTPIARGYVMAGIPLA
ncbi:hypothetical protein ACFQX6_37885 [Streptosporangium lutulentum]